MRAYDRIRRDPEGKGQKGEKALHPRLRALMEKRRRKQAGEQG